MTTTQALMGYGDGAFHDCVGFESDFVCVQTLSACLFVFKVDCFSVVMKNCETKRKVSPIVIFVFCHAAFQSQHVWGLVLVQSLDERCVGHR